MAEIARSSELLQYAIGLAWLALQDCFERLGRWRWSKQRSDECLTLFCEYVVRTERPKRFL
ncbi:hypothetical protein RSSM_05806 [Rhodopirellula sallentina SM41]|uniref:Uncharacterized protein n=1 Tax=Rhodopirellula sallentina SM41 TaxID=1263870 RepID=M5TU88_9BACT|nr:hypothetical protein RSSM_05806 [Rhodopirellula sallentina SM41]